MMIVPNFLNFHCDVVNAEPILDGSFMIYLEIFLVLYLIALICKLACICILVNINMVIRLLLIFKKKTKRKLQNCIYN